MSQELHGFQVRQEKDNPRPKLLLVVTAAVILSIIIGVIYTVFLMDSRIAQLPGQLLPAQFGKPREVRGTEQYLFDDEPGFPEEVGARPERRALESYGWVDRAQGIVRIPIEEAKELLLEEVK